MKNREKTLLVSLLIILSALIFLESTKKPPVNWTSTLSKLDKIPFGTFITYQELKKQAVSFEEINTSVFEFLQDKESKKEQSIYIANNLPFEKAETKKLLNWVAKGNTAFLSAYNFGQGFLDTLNLKIKSEIKSDALLHFPRYETTKPEDRASFAQFNRDTPIRYFSKPDSLTYTTLGKAFYESKDSKRFVNFIVIKHEKGRLLLHLAPHVFTNYFLLDKKENQHYTNSVLTQLNLKNKLYWDNHYSTNKTIANTSLLYVFLENKHLKWSYYFILLGLILFVIFKGKRTQRSIPILPVLTNQTYDYTKTIAGIYLEKQEHQEIVKKQINYFYSWLREELHIIFTAVDCPNLKQMVAKTGTSIEECEHLINRLNTYKNQSICSAEELEKVYKLIYYFKLNYHGREQKHRE